MRGIFLRCLRGVVGGGGETRRGDAALTAPFKRVQSSPSSISLKRGQLMMVGGCAVRIREGRHAARDINL